MTKQLFTLMGIFALLVAAMATSISVNATECRILSGAQADPACQTIGKAGQHR